jgi:DNA-binding response OmpR family regulator
MALSLPRQRWHGRLMLDLLAREAWADGQPLGLHPREFALLWRLLDQPGQAVTKATLLREVWHLTFQPETNSLAVHVSRLRGKLALAGLGHLVQTDGAGGYCLAAAEPAPPGVADPAEPVLERAVWKTVLPWEPSR